MFVNSKQLTIVVLIGILSSTAFSLIGCKKAPGPVKPIETAVADTSKQKLCPIMEGEINIELYTEYKGKKVYFCCPGCEEKFTAEPEKYLDKLPQFKE